MVECRDLRLCQDTWLIWDGRGSHVMDAETKNKKKEKLPAAIGDRNRLRLTGHNHDLGQPT